MDPLHARLLADLQLHPKAEEQAFYEAHAFERWHALRAWVRRLRPRDPGLWHRTECVK